MGMGKLGQRNGISKGASPVLTDVYHRLKVFGDSPRYPAEKAALFYARYVLSGINFPSKAGETARFVDLRISIVDLIEKWRRLRRDCSSFDLRNIFCTLKNSGEI